MLEATLAKGSVLKISDGIQELLNEAGSVKFECTDSGMQLQAINSSHDFLVSLQLRSDALGFDKYKCHRNMKMEMDITWLVKTLKWAADADHDVIINTKNNPDLLVFSFKKQNFGAITMEVSLINLDKKHFEIPKTDYSCIIKLSSTRLATICGNIGIFKKNVIISCSEEGMQFSIIGEHGAVYINVPQTGDIDNEAKAVVIEMQEPVTLTIDNQHLEKFSKPFPSSVWVTLSMSADGPLVVEYEIPDLGHIRYYVAPKIEDNDQDKVH